MPSRLRRLINALNLYRKLRKASKNKHGRRVVEYARDNKKRFNFNFRKILIFKFIEQFLYKIFQENHGVKSKASTQEPLLDDDQPAILKVSNHHDSNESVSFFSLNNLNLFF
jgi:hypothetical protein